MFKYLRYYKEILAKIRELIGEHKKADEVTARLLISLTVWVVFVALVIGSALIASRNKNSHQKVELQEKQQEEIHESYHEHGIYDVVEIPEDAGQGQSVPNPIDLLNPFSSFQESIANGLSEIIRQGIELFDTYVAFTPNVAKGDGQIVDAQGVQIPLGVDKYFRFTRDIAWAFLPLVIIITGAKIILEKKIKGIEILKQTGEKAVLLVVGMVSMRFVMSIAIDLTNALNRAVLNTFIGLETTDTLSESLLFAMGISVKDGTLEFTLESTLNIFGEIILWVALFFFLLTLLSQFVIRFFHILIHMILFPIILIIGFLPEGGKFFAGYIEEILRSLAVQPIFLIGLSLALEVMRGIDEIVPKLILGLSSIVFLNLIPAIVNRFSGALWAIGGGIVGGVLTAATANQARKLKQGFVSGVSGGRSHSVRSLASKAAGEQVASVFSKSKAKALKQPQGGMFKQSLKRNKDTNKAFADLNMKPLGSETLKPDTRAKDLYKATADFSGISGVSMRDSDTLSKSFVDSNFEPSLGGYPQMEEPASLSQLTDTSSFKAANMDTKDLMKDVVNTQKLNTTLGKTFDADNKEHWGHISQWYAKNESLTHGGKLEEYQEFTKKPENKKRVLRRAADEGYFKAQGIKTVKMTDQVKDQDPVTKYFKLKQPKKNFKPKKFKSKKTFKSKK